ncbi:hypothetical protein IC235_04375 [Hymenobacter sp. BT664]|uniref:Tandem-95 repeat protein n=1 Tax=Hymenobacter montanus TaxID=2771359 RepID=A0A927BAZ6_9BACT|nr:Ig-like domain-containing protein [Hymenobacter montanus]MBD2767131.1 hypothetical protein [Hymenobacter montanus]
MTSLRPALAQNVATTITPSSNPVAPGAALSFSVTYTNSGPGTANSYAQTLSLTAGLGTVSFPTRPTGVTATYNNTNGTVTFTGTPTSLAKNANQNLTVSIAAVPTTFTQVVASSTVSGTANNGATTTNSATSTVAVVTPVADVLTALTGPSTILQGQATGNFTATFTNSGPSTAASVTRTVTLPTGASVTAAQQTTITGNYPGTSFSTTGSGTSAVTTINFGTLASQVSGGTASFVFAFTAPLATGNVSIASNTSTSTSQNGATTNDAASLTVAVAPYADVFTSLSGPTTILQGQPTNNVMFTATFTNNGSGTATSVTRTVTLPPGASVTAAQQTTITGNYPGTSFSTTGSGASAVTTINFGTLASQASGGTASFVFAFTAPAATGNVSITSNTSTGTNQNGATANDVASLTVAVVPYADVYTTLTGPTTITGNVATGNFVVTFTNDGPSAADNVTRVVTLPPGATMTTAQVDASGGAYVAPASNTDSGTLTFSSLATLASKASSSFTFAFVPLNGNSSPAITTATIGTTTTQNSTTNDVAKVSSTVRFSPVPENVYNADVLSTNGPTPISALKATDQDGTIASYIIVTVPPTVQGVILYNSSTTGSGGSYRVATAGLSLTPAQATTLTFDPSNNYAGYMSFTYQAVDNQGNVSTTSNDGWNIVDGAAVFLIPVADGGVTANNDSNVVPINTATTGNVLLNDTSPESASMTVTTTGSITTANGTYTYNSGNLTTANGRVSMASNGVYTYTPNTGYLGLDRFDYQVCSSDGTTTTCNTATVFIRVYNPSTACSSSSGTNLLVNPDFNSGNTGFSTDYEFTSEADGLYPEGFYAVDVDGLFYHGAFQCLGRASATNPNDKFMIVNGAATVQRVYAQTVAVQPNRYYTFSCYVNNLISPGNDLGKPEIGFVINGESTSTTTIIEESPDRWVRVSDIWFSGSNTTATFEIRNRSTVATGNDFGIDDVYFGTCNLPPVANSDLTSTPLNTAVVFNILANDTDADGSIAANTVDLDPSTPGTNETTRIIAGVGTFTVTTAGSVTFTPATGFTGTASLTYTVRDNENALSNPGTISITVGPPPVDLATAITASASTINAGAAETLTIVASNNSTSNTATNVVQTVQLPAGLTNVTFGIPTVGLGAALVLGSTSSYNSTTGLVTFPTIASQAAGTTGNVSYTVSFNAPSDGAFSATANVNSTSNNDIDPTNNTASAAITVTPRFDLATTLSGPTTVVAGNQVTYNLTSANYGPSIAPGVVQTVTGLPTGLTAVYVSNNGTYNSGNGTVTFPTVSSFASGLSVTNVISFAAPASGTVITPVATLTPNTTGTGDTNPLNNTASLNGVVTTGTLSTPTTTAMANMQVSALTTSASSVAPGTTVTVNVTYTNAGPSTATGVMYQLALQPGFTVATLQVGGQTGVLLAGIITYPNGASYNTNTGIISFSSTGTTLNSASTQSYSLTFTAPNAGQVLVAASVRSTTSDPVSADNLATTIVNVLPSADVATSINGPATTQAGQAVTYTVTMANTGLNDAQNMLLTVELPASLVGSTLMLNGSAGTVSRSAVAFTNGAAYNINSGLLTLPVIASAAPGSSSGNAITFVAPVGLASFTATAVVSTATPETNMTNNTAAVTTVVTPSVDVRALVSGPTSAVLYSPVTYAVTTVNDGPSPVASVVPTLQLPANLNNVVLPTGASYSSSTGLVTFATISNLANGSAITNSVSFTMPDVAQLTGLAVSMVSGSAVDRNVDNNRAIIATSPLPPTDLMADLSVALTSSVASVNAGSAVTFTMTVDNGPITTSDQASGVRPVLALPAGLSVNGVQIGSMSGTYNSSTGLVTFAGGATYNVNTGMVIFPPVTLANSSAATYAPLVYTVTVSTPNASTLVATASVSSANTDLVAANNQATAKVTVVPQADLTTAISGPSSVPATASTVTYAVSTMNIGTSPAAASTTTVTLPAGASNIVAPAGSTISGTTVTLPAVSQQQPGSSGSVTQIISFTAPVGTPGSTFQVTATASTSTAESNTLNNGSSSTATRAYQLPVAQNVVNSISAPDGNTAATALPISPLQSTDTDGPITSYQLTSIPLTSQGVLYYSNAGTYTAITAANVGALNLTPTQAASLRFDPAGSYVGNVMFTYTATYAPGNVVSNSALYTLPVGLDNNSVYTATPNKGGANQYQNTDVLAYVIDPNGAAYNSDGLVYNTSGTTSTIKAANSITGLVNTPNSVVPAPSGSGPAASGLYPANLSNALPAGVALDATTGLIYVSDRTQLLRYASVQYFQVNVVTTDMYGGTNLVTARFSIGAYPLPVELTVFEAKAVKNVDAALAWSTASEKNNDHFEVERSLNGVDFVRMGEVKGQGSRSTPTEYALTDAGIGAKVSGPVYYRLKQVDTDGVSSYSPVRTVAFTGLTPAISLFPNPATTEATLDLKQLPAGHYQLSVLEATGRVVLSTTLEAGLTHALDLRPLAAGTYTVRVRSLNGAQVINLSKRLVKE